MTDDDIKRLRELCDKVTPGPWTASNREDRYRYVVSDANGMWVADCGNDPDGAEFIAAARTAVPELLAENESLRANVRQCAEIVGTHLGHGQHPGEVDAWTAAIQQIERHKAEILRLDVQLAKARARSSESAPSVGSEKAESDE